MELCGCCARTELTMDVCETWYKVVVIGDHRDQNLVYDMRNRKVWIDDLVIVLLGIPVPRVLFDIYTQVGDICS